MCGIFGVWERDGRPVDLEALRRAVSSMRHRGPDDEGYVLIDTMSGRAVPCGGPDTHPSLRLPRIEEFAGERFDLALGHRRLAIFDTSPAGHQPMTDGRNWIVHSGEILNFEQRRREDRTYRTGTDTEVLLSEYEDDLGKWPSTDLEGMWGFAIWDPERRSLFCSRDRFGIKPFYYRGDRGRFVFASEIKGILAYGGGGRGFIETALADYLAWGMTDHSDETFFEGVRSLEPGHELLVDADGLRPRRYWTLEGSSPGIPLVGVGKRPPSLAERFPDVFRRSVEAHLRSDVPVGTCLSGGLDSSSIVCIAASLPGGDGLRTFTATFDDPEIDERAFAAEAASAAGARPHFVSPSGEELLDALPELVRSQEQPFVSTSVYAQRQVMRLAKESGVTVLLDGQGGDEVLSGYPQAFDIYLRWLFRTGHWTRLAREATASGGAAGALGRAAGRSPVRLRQPPPWMEQAAVAAGDAWRYPQNASLRDVMATDLRYRLPALLRFEERNSMAFGLEARVPFLDHALVDLAYGLDDRRLIRNGMGKAILRDAMSGIVPDPILGRRDKVGFRTPERDWLLGANRERVKEIVLSGALARSPFVHGDLAGWIAAVEAGREPVGSLWRWLCLTVWMQEFFPA